jgi:hypothetical protein
MATSFEPGDRVWVAKHNLAATVETVRKVEGDACVVYDGEGRPDSFGGGPHKREFFPFDQLSTNKAEVPALDEGEEITVVWGEEKYSPKPYMNFAVGPIYAKTKLRPGETADEAHARVWKWLEARAREQFNSQLNRFRINLQEL